MVAQHEPTQQQPVADRRREIVLSRAGGEVERHGDGQGQRVDDPPHGRGERAVRGRARGELPQRFQRRVRSAVLRAAGPGEAGRAGLGRDREQPVEDGEPVAQHGLQRRGRGGQRHCTALVQLRQQVRRGCADQRIGAQGVEGRLLLDVG
ncbi:MAG: hypothetical protein LC789_09465 [Actinobacteria bacterium]|nr:hypothetical protein [Actinomycetota bacterium]